MASRVANVRGTDIVGFEFFEGLLQEKTREDKILLLVCYYDSSKGESNQQISNEKTFITAILAC